MLELKWENNELVWKKQELEEDKETNNSTYTNEILREAHDIIAKYKEYFPITKVNLEVIDTREYLSFELKASLVLLALSRYVN